MIIRVRIFQLLLQNRRTGIAIGRAFFKLVVFSHGLIVQVFAVNHKHHLIYIRQLTHELGGFETGQSFSRSGRVPNISTRLNRAEFLIVGADFQCD